jgi:hypothetical protein
MRHVARLIFTLISALSLLLCVAACGMWMRSVSTLDKLEYQSQANWLAMVISKSGRMDLVYISPWQVDDPGFLYFTEFAPFALRGPDYSKRFLGFGGGVQLNGGRFVNIPYWFLALLFALPPAMTIRGILRRRARRPGLCPNCGYDLRAHSAGERCPECGTANIPAL